MSVISQRASLPEALAPPKGPRDEFVNALSKQLHGADAVEILDYVIHKAFPEKIALVSSFGAESAVLLKLAAQVNKNVPVLFIDTGKHFAQTLQYRRDLIRTLDLKNVITLNPDEEDLTNNDPHGTLWRNDPDQCCTLRKVQPLTSALRPYEAWITGRKQFHGGLREYLPVIEVSGEHIKVNPLAHWSHEQITHYTDSEELPAHPLVSQGYPSIGCWPCTHPANEADDIRAGRWRGAAKTECGIHSI